MSHTETLIMNEVRKALENLQKNGVGYINYEDSNVIYYCIDEKQISVRICTIAD